MNRSSLYQGLHALSKQWQGVTRHFRASVVTFSQGVARARSTHLRKIAACSQGQLNSQRRRLQRFVGRKLNLTHFFGEWTRSVMTQVAPTEVTLVVDETKLKNRFGVMVVGLAYRRRCVPLAWRVYAANDAGAYPAHGQVALILELLQAVQAGLPGTCPVRVLADRGIGTSPELMRGVMELGWTFLFRVTKPSKVILPDGTSVTFYAQVSGPTDTYTASGHVFKQRGRIPAHVRVLWREGAKEPWALVTNDPHLTGWEYAQRMWVEQAFRDLKSHGWHLDQTQMRTPQRLAQLWIILVVAYTWLLLVGESLAQTQAAGPRRRLPDGTEVHQWSFFRIGLLAFIKAHQFHPT